MLSAGIGTFIDRLWSFDSREKNTMWHLTRRTLLAGAAVMAGNAALAQSAPPARVKGPLVWLDLDQKELDDAYDQSVYAPNQRQITGRYVTNSEAVRARIGADTDRRARSLRRQDAERAGPGVHPRRRLARGPRQGL